MENAESVRRNGMKVLANSGLGRGRKRRPHPPWETGFVVAGRPTRGFAVAWPSPRSLFRWASWHPICTIHGEEVP